MARAGGCANILRWRAVFMPVYPSISYVWAAFLTMPMSLAYYLSF